MAYITVHGHRTARNTRIEVVDWPRPDATWVVSTRDHRGRVLCATGWHNFSHRTFVGAITLHVERRASLLIRAYTLAPSLITAERPEVLATLGAAAQAVATKLYDELNVGDGCLDWHVPHGKAIAVQRLVPGFVPADGRRRRGHTRLRRCP